MKKSWYKRSWTPFVQAQDTPWGLLFHNNRYHVFVRRVRNPQEGGPDIVHLSIRDNSRSATHDWRDLQRIKSELVGPEIEMVEIYPQESQLVDLSNQFHLWGYDTTEPVFTQAGLGFKQGRHVWDGIGPQPEVPGHDVSKAVQRPIGSEQ